MSSSSIATLTVSVMSLAALLTPAQAADTVCALDSAGTGEVFRWVKSDQRWESLYTGASQIYSNPTGLLATTNGNTKVERYDGGGWSVIGGGGSKFVGTDLGIYGLPIAKDAVYQYDSGDTWNSVGGPAADIFGNGQSALFATNTDDTEIWHYDDAGWTRVGDGGADFAVHPDGTLYGLSADKSTVSQWSGQGTGWSRIGDGANRIYAGGYGLVATSPDNNELWGHVSGTVWQKIGDGGRSFAVTDNGVFGLTDAGAVYEFAGTVWTQLAQAGTKIGDIVPC